jgi:hypothetical protein
VTRENDLKQMVLVEVSEAIKAADGDREDDAMG